MLLPCILICSLFFYCLLFNSLKTEQIMTFQSFNKIFFSPRHDNLLFCCCLKHFSSLFIFIPFTGQPHKQLLQHTSLVNGQRAFLKTGTFWGTFTTNRKKKFLLSANFVWKRPLTFFQKMWPYFYPDKSKNLSLFCFSQQKNLEGSALITYFYF